MPMTQDLREKLSAEIGPVFWSDLRAHSDRGGLILVRGGLELLDAALAVAQDNGTQVETWIREGKLQRPTTEQLAAWSENLEQPFRAVVVKPFALAQMTPDETSN